MHIPYGRQDINQADIDAVVAVLRSSHLTQGPAVPAFESCVAGYCGAAHAVAVSSATAALHLACSALDIGPGDVVWTSPITFVASANCALYCGAAVDFVDIDPETYNMSVRALEEKLAEAQVAGRLPKAVIPVHLCGQSCDMQAIAGLADRYGFRVIEDASHAVGAGYLGSPVGGCRFSDITVFSFHPVKIVTTGEGGMALTNNRSLARRMERLRSHGITREADEMTAPPDGPWYYQQLDLGFNYRMTDLQAALGRSQMSRLDEFVSRRAALAERYSRILAGLPVKLPRQHPDTSSSWHLYVVRVDQNAVAISKPEIFRRLHQDGIGVNLHYIPVYLQPYYSKLGFRKGLCPEAESYYAEAISLPVFFGLTEGDQDRVASALENALAK